MNDPEGAYRDLRVRVTELVRAQDPATLDAIAPATPQWRVRDVVAHLAGVCDDIVAGNLEGVASDEWTDAQVVKRSAWTVDEVLADWERNATHVEPNLAALPPVAVGQMIFDATTHEQDVRGALGVPGGRDAGALAMAFEWAVERLAERLASRGARPLRFETDAGTSAVGSGAAPTTLTASRFEIVRAMTGRRSVDQVSALDWDGPPRVDDLLLADFFVPPVLPIVE